MRYAPMKIGREADQMSEVAILNANRTLELPEEIAKRFQISDRFVVWADGDTLHLKRIAPSPLDVVAHAPVENPLSAEEINDIIHEVRRQKRQQNGE